MANLLIDVLRSYVAAKKFKLHDFVIMPNHVHLLLSVDQSTTIEKAVQFVKGGFSYRAKKELGHQGEIWQQGFSELRVKDREGFLKYRAYINENPVAAGIVHSPENFPYGSAHFKHQTSAAAEAKIHESLRHE